MSWLQPILILGLRTSLNPVLQLLLYSFLLHYFDDCHQWASFSNAAACCTEGRNHDLGRRRVATTEQDFSIALTVCWQWALFKISKKRNYGPVWGHMSTCFLQAWCVMSRKPLETTGPFLSSTFFWFTWLGSSCTTSANACWAFKNPGKRGESRTQRIFWLGYRHSSQFTACPQCWTWIGLWSSRWMSPRSSSILSTFSGHQRSCRR